MLQLPNAPSAEPLRPDLQTIFAAAIQHKDSARLAKEIESLPYADLQVLAQSFDAVMEKQGDFVCLDVVQRWLSLNTLKLTIEQAVTQDIQRRISEELDACSQIIETQYVVLGLIGHIA